MGTSKLVYIGAGVLFLIALFFLHHFWPDQDKQKLQAIFLLLQFAATLALLAVTAYYATAAWALVESQNREPEIRILGAPIPLRPDRQARSFRWKSPSLFRILVCERLL